MPVRVLVCALPSFLALAIACSGGEGGSPPPGGEGGSGGAGGTGGEAPVAGALHGTVLLVDGAPAVGATVTLPGREAVVVGSDGAYAFDELPPGSHEFAVSLAPYRSEARAVAVEVGVDAEVAPVVLQRIASVDAGDLGVEAARTDDGGRLLFTAGRDRDAGTVDAWLWDDAGGARKLASGAHEGVTYAGASSFSPDGRWLVGPLGAPDEWKLVDSATGTDRSLGLDLWEFRFWTDSSRLVWTERPGPDLVRRDTRTLALPSLEETLLCERSDGVAAIAADHAVLICEGGVDGGGDYYGDLVRWDLATMAPAPLADDARIVGATPALDRVLLLTGDDEVGRTGVLWRLGREPVVFATGAAWNGASCDAAVERGFLLADGELFRLDLVAGTAVWIDTGVGRMRPSPSHEQVFYYKDLVDGAGRLFTWDEVSGTSLELGANVRDGQHDPFNDWPRMAAFVVGVDEPGHPWSVGDLHVYRFDGQPSRLLATRANAETIGPAGLAFFHDVDEGWVGNLSLLPAGADAAVPIFAGVRYREEGSRSPPRIAPGLDRILAYAADPQTGRHRTLAWSRVHGATDLPGVIEELEPSFARALVFEAGPGDTFGPGTLRLFDFATGAAETLGAFVPRSWCWHDPALARIAFVAREDEHAEPALWIYDHGTGERRRLVENASGPRFWANDAWTHALVGIGLGAIEDVYLAELATGRTLPVGSVDMYDRWPRSGDGNRYVVVESGYDEEASSGRLLLLDLPSLTATLLDEAAAPVPPWATGDLSAIVYLREATGLGYGEEPSGELWARGLRPDAPRYRVDAGVRGRVLGSAGWFLYEVAGQGIRAGEWPR